jgi:DNA-binding Xre family transcriptional regulator
MNTLVEARAREFEAPANPRLREENERLRADLNKALGLEFRRSPPGPMAAGEVRRILAVNLRVRMAQRDINQRELSDLAGISQRHISQIMNCATGVTIDVVEILARALNTSPADLLTHHPGL